MSPEEREQVVWQVMNCMADLSLSDDAERIMDQVVAPLLVEAERRGKEQGWDESARHARSIIGYGYSGDANPYRRSESP